MVVSSGEIHDKALQSSVRRSFITRMQNIHPPTAVHYYCTFRSAPFLVATLFEPGVVEGCLEGVAHCWLGRSIFFFPGLAVESTR